ncbi:MAG: proline racemase family protein [Candidatus Dormibacteraeota bacterium]|nr:proline racemase family protein [Candidatus Dormibacteraeota bacterium]
MRFERLITAVDAHAGGLPGRVITGGVIDVAGATMFEKMLHLREHGDDLRRLMLREPRGYPASCCSLILPATRPEAVAGYVIMEQTEYPPMSGTNTICVATVLIETGMVPVSEPITAFLLESPAGLIAISARVEAGKATAITFRNVPAFAMRLDAHLEIPALGTVSADIAYGGMFYVIAEAAAFGLQLTPDEGRDIVRVGEMLRLAASEQCPVRHPENAAITGPSISQLSGVALGAGADRRNAVTMPTGQPRWDRADSFVGAIDRSPCGTGTCAKMATLHARGQLGLGQNFRHEGVLGTVFTGRLLEATSVGEYPAVVPTITGQAWITGFAQYVVDPTDPFPAGYTVTDIWGQ